MSPKRWFVILIACAVIIAAGIAVLNLTVDPFGVFGDRLFNWYSYDMTNNPKAAKFVYLEQHNSEYDAYVLGPSGSSGLNPLVLEEYTGLRWYNMFNYGADMKYTESLAKHMIENYEVKQLILCLPIISAGKYDLEPGGVTEYQPLSFAWRLPFLFADPRYAIDKIRKYDNDGYLQAAHDVFVPGTGTYDKSVRDSEGIGSLDEYLERNAVFTTEEYKDVPLTYIEECVTAVENIKSLCEEQGIELTVILPPIYKGATERYSYDDVEQFFFRLAEVTDFWDFSVSDISGDARYFYDKTHFRNSVGDMVLARIFGSELVYDDFGQLVDESSAKSAVKRFATIYEYSAVDTAELTVLMYHNIIESGSGDSVNRSVTDFRADMQRLRDDGCNVVGLEDLIGYVELGEDLPNNPVLITFDDGYMSNYRLAFPILKEFGYKATIFIIGVSFDKETYKESERVIIPHFGFDEAREMIDSGLITIQSHTYDMHNVEGLDIPYRSGVLQMDGESEAEYITAFELDFEQEQSLMSTLSDSDIIAAAYPNGYRDTLSQTLMYEHGVKITFTSDSGTNTLIKGIPQSLLNLKRIVLE